MSPGAEDEACLWFDGVALKWRGAKVGIWRVRETTYRIHRVLSRLEA